jgi:hypothetical protein
MKTNQLIVFIKSKNMKQITPKCGIEIIGFRLKGGKEETNS